MIAKRLRVSPRDFPKDAPVRSRSPYFLVKTRNNRLPHLRFGIITPSAAIPTAVGRHRLKRWILSRSRELPGSGKDILFILTREAARASKKDLLASLDSLISSFIP